jgi:hypothetical protein
LTIGSGWPTRTKPLALRALRVDEPREFCAEAFPIKASDDVAVLKDRALG